MKYDERDEPRCEYCPRAEWRDRRPADGRQAYCSCGEHLADATFPSGVILRPDLVWRPKRHGMLLRFALPERVRLRGKTPRRIGRREPLSERHPRGRAVPLYVHCPHCNRGMHLEAPPR